MILLSGSYRHRVFLIDRVEAIVDRDIATEIEQLNKLGFRTIFCCSGTYQDHPSYKKYTQRNSYIAFVSNGDSEKNNQLDPLLEEIKAYLKKTDEVELSFSIDKKSVGCNMRFPIGSTDEVICRALKTITQYILNHKTEFMKYLAYKGPHEILTIGDIDKIKLKSVDLIQIYQTKLEKNIPELFDWQKSLIISYLGTHYYYSKKFDLAIECLLKSIEIDKQLHHLKAEAENLKILSCIYSKIGESELSRKTYQLSLDLVGEKKEKIN